MWAAKCDKCGKETPPTDNTSLPTGWAHLRLHVSGSANVTYTVRSFGAGRLLCEECLTQYGVSSVEAPAENKDAADILWEMIQEMIQEEVQSQLN